MRCHVCCGNKRLDSSLLVYSYSLLELLAKSNIIGGFLSYTGGEFHRSQTNAGNGKRLHVAEHINHPFCN